ncbi:peptide-methionine (R)-S-oxide reductase MsrB [Idiomarina xiamenensis]|uniref:Peptide methionine sulfoxide reductase MsrB n=1 Tax=Idiomarina xiamenensis 10-D-4 TaxID=740709 RepID=K2KK72_9GAMM|nr:peptide-methionine (R)-S-oxide reductase MsrB [Idiomarina xiamenensis]EKE87042.1 methionine sulfoxide reductase B [Idiomarina xiamenensis 10-D-4]
MDDIKQLSEQEWRQRLNDEQYRILREGGTERPFSGRYIEVAEDGAYHCAGCGATLFAAASQFASHCGWPSFDQAIDGAIDYRQDDSHGMQRTEILCRRCGGHLGHVFDDGPTASGQRYCVNSLALQHEADD